MLTKDDQTVKNAHEVYQQVRHLGLSCVGFKDIGLPFEQLKALAQAIRDDGREVYLEVVSLDRAAEIRSAQAAVDIGVDCLLGGTHPDDVLPVIHGTGIKYWPFPGKIIGHPSLLRGSRDEIVASASALGERAGVYGLDLLAYRFDGDVPELVKYVIEATQVPVIAAGSVNSLERIGTLAQLGVWGFTVGSAVFEGVFGSGLDAQLKTILAASRK